MASIRRTLTAVLVAATLVLASSSSAFAATAPYQHVWRVQSEVGGDRGGRFEQAVLADSLSLESVAGGYRGTLVYGDRLTVQDGSGQVLVQVSSLNLNLVGAPAAGGGAIAGTFDGTARLDTYTTVAFEDGAAGRLPAAPSSSATYDVLGHWGAQLAGGTAAGDLAFGSAVVRSARGPAVTRDATWFSPAETGAQAFTVAVAGTAAPAGDGDAGGTASSSAASGRRLGVLDYILAGLTGRARVPAVPVPAELAAAARLLRDARPVGATAMPANTVTIDLDVAGHTLDAKNRAFGTTVSGRAGTRARAAWNAAAAAAPAPGEPAAAAAALDGILATSEVSGARELRAAVRSAADAPMSSQLLTQVRVREWLAAVRAVEGSRQRGVLAAVGALAGAVRDSRATRGAAADALLAAADSLDAPPTALEVRRFARREGLDVPGAGAGTAPQAAPTAGGWTPLGLTRVSWRSAGASRTVEPQLWLAHERSDGAVYWLAGLDGPVAVTDASLDGFAFTTRRGCLVDAARAGRVLAVLPATSGR